ncbi:MAG: terpene cyclase/mutase family protein [Armatimonadetes bacterium]|nr:terpene cyclase/mutase family protein [Armatimonadota bacterium]
MSTYLSRAVAYVEQHGSELERARLRGILGQRRHDPRVVRTLVSRQNDDGGFPYDLLPGRPSSLHYTLTALAWLRDVRLTASAAVTRLIAYLFTIQRPDGSWDENPAVVKFEPPGHLQPGTPRSRGTFTAATAFWLCVLGQRADQSVLRACQYLRAHTDGEGRIEGFPSATWAGAAVFAMASGRDAEETRSVLGAVQAMGVNWPAADLAGLLECVGAAGFPAGHALVHAASARLLSLQQDDGGWPSADGGAHPVEVTLQALRALLLLGVSAV